MDFKFNTDIVTNYKSNSQRIRVMSENWLENNIYCPCCGNNHLKHLYNNMPVADFACDNCGEIFELKTKCGQIGRKITDGAYSTMIERITSNSNPDLFVMSYNNNLSVTDLIFIPKFFFIPDFIERRKPLSSNARRAGWVGCNILFSNIPSQGKIPIIQKEQLIDHKQVIEKFSKIKRLRTNQIEGRGWIFDILNCINDIPKNLFSLNDVYAYKDMLKIKHPQNFNIEAKIRQQLQFLRDKGYIEFLGNGQYKKNL